MSDVRPATPDDAAELVRLRRLMFHAMTGHDEGGAWEATADALLRAALSCPADPASSLPGGGLLGAFVIDAPTPGAALPSPAGGPGPAGRPLAACAVGTIERRLPAPLHPSGLFGFVFNVCTDPGHRGRGYARATTRALLDWFTGHGVTRIDLHATPNAEAMYRAFGFAEHSTALSLTLPPPRPGA
jgi:ribosomal protein S18 acetylase RimI-like enzyme